MAEQSRRETIVARWSALTHMLTFLRLFRYSGQEEYERLRPMSYSKSHVILIAFAIDTPDSLDNVTVKVRYATIVCELSQLTALPINSG